MVRAAEFQLVQERPVQLVDPSGLRSEARIVAVRIVVLTLHVQSLGALVADDVLAGLALHGVDDDELAGGTDQILVHVGVKQNGSETTWSGHAADGGGADVGEAEPEDWLRFFDAVVHLAWSSDKLHLVAEGALIILVAAGAEEVLWTRVDGPLLDGARRQGCLRLSFGVKVLNFVAVLCLAGVLLVGLPRLLHGGAPDKYFVRKSIASIPEGLGVWLPLDA